MKTRVQGKERYFFIDEELFKRVRQLISDNNHEHPKGRKRLKLDMAVFFLDLIARKRNQRKNRTGPFVHLDSRILKRYQDNYSEYFKFFVQHRIVRIKQYDTLKGKAKGYRIIYPRAYRRRKWNMIKYSPEDFVLQKKLDGEAIGRRTVADKKCGHLTKWLTPEFLQVDYEAALEHIHGQDDTDARLYSKRYAIEMLHNGAIYYHREGKDNRLHSNLTNLSKELRPFIKFKGNQDLVSLDLKSSQPFLLVGMINLLIGGRGGFLLDLVEHVEGKTRREKIHTVLSTMLRKSFGPPEITELREFIDLVVNKDVYEYLGSQLSSKFRWTIETPIGISDKFYDSSLSRKVMESFGCMRDYCKSMMMEYLYCSTKSRERRYSEARRILPNTLNELVDGFKKDRKEDFPIFLQSAEAYLFLDVITKVLDAENLNIPLFTIHDSIITTRKYQQLVRDKMEKVLMDTFGLVPTIHVEQWCF